MILMLAPRSQLSVQKKNGFAVSQDGGSCCIEESHDVPIFLVRQISPWPSLIDPTQPWPT
jgi:hypothetical protein